MQATYRLKGAIIRWKNFYEFAMDDGSKFRGKVVEVTHFIPTQDFHSLDFDEVIVRPFNKWNHTIVLEVMYIRSVKRLVGLKEKDRNSGKKKK